MGASEAAGAAVADGAEATGFGAFATSSGLRGGGAAHPVSPDEAGGAPPTTNTVASAAYE